MSSTGAIPKGARPKIKTLPAGNTEKNEDFGTPHQNKLDGTSPEPLEKKEIYSPQDGVQMKRKALSSFWIENGNYIIFSMPPQSNDDGIFVPGAIEAWIEQADFLIEDLTWILSLPHHIFWSQISFDTAFHQCLESYLSNMSRWYEDDIPDERFSSYLDLIHQKVFHIYVRMATYKEAKEDHISPSTFGYLIYEYFLFDICKMIDLSVLYGATNAPLLKKMFDNIFTNQKKYFRDLSEFISSLKKVFENLENSLGISQHSMYLVCRSEITSSGEISNLIDYLIDIFFSLEIFLTLFPKGAEYFRQDSFDTRLASFYEKVIPLLVKAIGELDEYPENGIWVMKYSQRLALARMACLLVFRRIVENSCCCSLLPDNSQESVPPNVENTIEKFVYTFSTCIEEKTFIIDYNSTFKIEDDIRVFKDCGADMTTLNFLQEAVTSTVAEVKKTLDLEKGTKNLSLLTDQKTLPPNQESKNGDSSGMNVYYSGETSQISSIEVASLISSIMDLLPELGAGFIKECLVYYNYSTEEVLNALLENNLPPPLLSLPRDKKLEEEQLKAPKEGEPLSNNQEEINPIDEEVNDVMARANIYNDDEYDVFSKKSSLNLKQIHKGKKNIADKKDSLYTSKVKELGHKYDMNLGYSIYEDEFKYQPIKLVDYEDEYDDTYDDNEAGNLDDFSFDKKKLSILTLRGAGALNVPGLDFTGEGSDESDSEIESKGQEENPQQQRPSFNLKDSKEIREMSGNFRRQHRHYQGKPDPKKNANAMVFENSKFKRRHNPASHQNGGPVSQNGDEPHSEENNKKQQPDSFCENPEYLRRREEERRISKMERKRNWRSGVSFEKNEEQEMNDSHSTSTPLRGGGHSKGPRGRARHNASNGEYEASKHGKNKDDSSSGFKDNSYRYKTAHKNQDRRRAAQAKYRGGF